MTTEWQISVERTQELRTKVDELSRRLSDYHYDLQAARADAEKWRAMAARLYEALHSCLGPLVGTPARRRYKQAKNDYEAALAAREAGR